MLKTILSISGKPGLFKLVSQGKNMLIVESLSDKRRVPAYARDKVISLGDIAIYTDDDEVPLHVVLTSIKEKEKGEKATIDLKSVKPEDLRSYLGEVLPNFDRERVYPSDIKKLISWYNLLVENGLTDFAPEKAEEETATVDKAEAKEEPKAEEPAAKEEKKETKAKKTTKATKPKKDTKKSE